MDKELKKSDVEDVLRLIEGTTTESLEQMQEDIDFFMEEKNEKEKSTEGSNPFLALIGAYNEKDEEKIKNQKSETNKEKSIRSDDWIEKTHIRKLAIDKSEETAFSLFDIYKKAHGMVSYT